MQISESLQQLKGKNPTHTQKKEKSKKKKKQNSAYLLNCSVRSFYNMLVLCLAIAHFYSL